MTKRRLGLALSAVFVAGLVARLAVFAFERPHHPDEFFQYLEPAWYHLTGVGAEAWEWRRGVRSWVLPGYNGAWMALLLKLGVHHGSVIAKLVRLHWTILSLCLVWAGWRGGSLVARRLGARGEPCDDGAPAGWQGGLAGAVLCAGFPWLLRFSTHTLSEMAALLCLAPAIVLAGEVIEDELSARNLKALSAGVLLGLGTGLRLQYAPVALVAGIALLAGRRFRKLAVVVLGALAVLLFFGLVDLLTWKGLFASFVRYVQFNFLEGGAANFGVLPSKWYSSQLFHRLPYGLPVLGVACLLGIRRSWALVSAALAVVALHTFQAHKEERFVALFWPLVLIAAAGCIGGWAGRASSGRPFWPRSSRLRLAIAAVVVVGVLVDGGLHAAGNDFDMPPERFAAHAWVGRQTDLTGLLYDEPLFVGGYLCFGQPFPQVQFAKDLLANPLFTHVLAGRDSRPAELAQAAGFRIVYGAGDFVVLRRGE
jgi:GPI mannosyltransferase 3